MLTALVNYYDAKEKRNEISKVGWAETKVSGAIELDESGKVLAIHDLHEIKTAELEAKNRKESVKLLTVPQIPGRTVNIAPGFLCDNTKYIFGFEKDKPERFDKYFESFRDLHLEMISEIDTPAANALRRFLTQDENRNLTEALKEKLDTGNFVFRFNGKYLHDYPELKSVWDNKKDSSLEDVEDICSITGKKDVIVNTHPPIKGVFGSKPNATLVSYNSSAFESYGKKQNMNSHIGRTASVKYTTALNQLLADGQSHTKIGDTTIVYWAESATPIYQSVFSGMLGNQVDKDVERIIDPLFKKIQRHEAFDVENINLQQKFFILGLSANAARLVVRFFLEGTFGNLIKNFADHNKRLEIIKPDNEQPGPLSPSKIVDETVSRKSKEKNPLPSLPGDLMNSIFQNTQYPESLYSSVLLRIRTDPGSFNSCKAAILKAYLIKNKKKGGLEMSLNETNNSQPYVLGRLFSVLENLQNKASGGGLNSTIKDKYFASAAATPGRIFPLLLHNSANHLKKIKQNEALTTTYEKKIGELIDRLEGTFPNTLSLEEQGEFYIGYYQQRQHYFAELKAKQQSQKNKEENE
ncbi:type I-C CRISPR-associated protein Cas8c/Csd1 [Allobaculum stercoricanis]|uniref:type I-C CRISPR-associated protein Cas8c/Csd1 n=1 Tax=Allobaculum stercoricanis TaxID=174709 RepID=UPI00248D643D|nr:type I-C CRISPR-associated protein Cas8c/Csd1 [Allobaculum stercoricanis]